MKLKLILGKEKYIYLETKKKSEKVQVQMNNVNLERVYENKSQERIIDDRIC